MAEKKVILSLSQHVLGREERSANFEVYSGNAKLGMLCVSKGGLRWYPKNAKGGRHHFTGWGNFATLIEEHVPKTK